MDLLGSFNGNMTFLPSRFLLIPSECQGDSIIVALSMPGFQGTRQQSQPVILALFACLGILYLVPKVLPVLTIGPHDHFDFAYLWVAGKIWASGQNPYDGPLFAKEYNIFYQVPPPSNRVLFSPWFYPPYWYPLIVPFALLPFQIALSIWKVINFSLLIGATHLIARTLADVARQKYLPIFFAGLGFVCFMYATAVTAWSGQTSILVYFGLSAFIFGLLKARPRVLIIGLVFLALKPQFGIMAFAAVAALHRYRWTAIPAAAICFLCSTAIAITGDYRASVEGFLINLPRHSEHPGNTPPNLTGLIHILDYAFSNLNISLSELIAFLAAIICTVVVFYKSPLNKMPKVEDTEQTVAVLALFVAASFFFIPLHYYDMVALVALLMMIIAVPLAGRWLIVPGLLICFRPDYLLHAIGVATPPEFQLSHLMSAGLFLLFIGAVWSYLGHGLIKLPSDPENNRQHA
jgi:hypothetical protein